MNQERISPARARDLFFSVHEASDPTTYTAEKELAHITPGRARALLAAVDAKFDPTTCTAHVGEHFSEWLMSLFEPPGMTDLGGGRIRLTASDFAYLRSLPEGFDGRIDDRMRISIGGEEDFPVTRDR